MNAMLIPSKPTCVVKVFQPVQGGDELALERLWGWSARFRFWLVWNIFVGLPQCAGTEVVGIVEVGAVHLLDTSGARCVGRLTMCHCMGLEPSAGQSVEDRQASDLNKTCVSSGSSTSSEALQSRVSYLSPCREQRLEPFLAAVASPTSGSP